MASAPYELPSTNLSFSTCSITLGNAAPAASSNLSASVLFGDNWTAPNGIIGYGALQNSGVDRIANSPTSINLGGYLGLNTRGDNSAFGGGFGSYWVLWDNQLSGGDDEFDNVYFYLWDSTKTFQLTSDYLASLNPSTNTGYTNIGDQIPLVQYAYWEVVFDINKNTTNPFTFEIQCDTGGGFNVIYSLNQTWSYPSSANAFAWNDGGGNLSVETANPTYGYAFQILFY